MYVRYLFIIVVFIIVVDFWKLVIDKSEKVVCIFLDLRKYFDFIEYVILISKLLKCGVNDNEFDWFKSYLEGRN